MQYDWHVLYTRYCQAINAGQVEGYTEAEDKDAENLWDAEQREALVHEAPAEAWVPKKHRKLRARAAGAGI
jgi:hypothetical protein